MMKEGLEMGGERESERVHCQREVAVLKGMFEMSNG